MKLSGFERGTELTIASVKKHSQHEFETEILSTDDGKNTILVKPVTINGRIVHFSDPEVMHTITVNAGRKVFAYQNVTMKEIQTNTKPSKYALCIQSEEDVEAVNRREFFRVFLGVNGTMQAGANHKAQEVVIKDVSANGVGVICPKTLHLPIGTNVYVNFIDGLTMEEFKLDCEIVRHVEHDEENVVYGCQLPESSDDMEKFVALKQRIH